MFKMNRKQRKQLNFVAKHQPLIHNRRIMNTTTTANNDDNNNNSNNVNLPLASRQQTSTTTLAQKLNLLAASTQHSIRQVKEEQEKDNISFSRDDELKLTFNNASLLAMKHSSQTPDKVLLGGVGKKNVMFH